MIPGTPSLTTRRLPRARILVVGFALVVASSAVVQVSPVDGIRIASGVAATVLLLAGGLLARRRDPQVADAVLALGALSVFPWFSAVMTGIPAIDRWLAEASPAWAFLVVNAMKLSSVAVLAVIALALRWPRDRLMIRVGDPRARTGIPGVRWTIAGPVVIVAVLVLFLTDPDLLPPRGQPDVLLPVLPLLVAGPIVNAICEELLYRHALLGTMVPLIGPAATILSTSAVFGLAHITGTPGGLLGVGATFVYGLICALALHQARGAVWNVPIHVLGDVGAVTAIVLAAP